MTSRGWASHLPSIWADAHDGCEGDADACGGLATALETTAADAHDGRGRGVAASTEFLASPLPSKSIMSIGVF